MDILSARFLEIVIPLRGAVACLLFILILQLVSAVALIKIAWLLERDSND